jgi:hypothetical protein
MLGFWWWRMSSQLVWCLVGVFTLFKAKNLHETFYMRKKKKKERELEHDIVGVLKETVFKVSWIRKCTKPAWWVTSHSSIILSSYWSWKMKRLLHGLWPGVNPVGTCWSDVREVSIDISRRQIQQAAALDKCVQTHLLRVLVGCGLWKEHGACSSFT